MLISCILSTYTVAVLCSFHYVWLQLDDNWLKPFAFYDSVARDGVFARLGDSIFSLRGGEINSYYWPWCKPTGDTSQTSSSLAPWFACGASFTIFPDCFQIFQKTSRVGPLKATPSPFLTGCRTQTEVMVARSPPPDWRLCSLCRRVFFFSPPLLGRQRCSWWILKQISLIIVFHNCHAERDCPLRSYLCHCTPPPHTHTPPSLYRLFNKTQITTEIVKSTSKIIKSKWRIYRWHFITINLRHLINKPPPTSRRLPRLHPPHH